jgi:hypothetical protein
VRLRGVEPPRPVRATRPSTLRVYQFRHRREGWTMIVALGGSSRRCRGGSVRRRTLLETVRGARYSHERVFAQEKLCRPGG